MRSIKVKLILIAVITLFISDATAQNIQLHYDLGRNAATSTVEMFRPDKVGNTFLCIDMEYTPNVSDAYWEIARELCFWQETKANWLSLHVEYNGGINAIVGPYNNAFLGGLTYSGHSKDWSKTWSITASYKAIPRTIGLNGKAQTHNFQITGVWNFDFFNRWLSFYGFADFWREARPWQGTEYIFIAEPQLWLNLNRIKGCDKINLSIGSEVELSCNLLDKGFYVLPTVAVKWTF